MNDLASFWFLLTCIFAGSTIWLAISRRRARKRTEKYIDQMLLDRRLPETPVSPKPSVAPTLDSLAEAIERLTQQQQFLIRVMSERPSPPDAPNRGVSKWVTPH